MEPSSDRDAYRDSDRAADEIASGSADAAAVVAAWGPFGRTSLFFHDRRHEPRIDAWSSGTQESDDQTEGAAPYMITVWLPGDEPAKLPLPPRIWITRR
jgi:hypothetical protein